MSAEIGVGVIGAGGIAQIAHLPVLSRFDEVRITGLCDNDLSKAKALADRFGIADVYDDIEDLLRFSRPDAVVICTPNHLHEVHVQAALSAGAHVLCERPLALSLRGTEKLIAEQKKTDRVLMVGMNNRYRSDVQVVRSFLQRGDLGRLRAIRAGWYLFRPSRIAFGWRLKKEQAGGGVMLDLGLSLLDLGLWLAENPQPKRVSATFCWDDEETDIEDAGTALITCDNGMSIFIDVTWRYLGLSEKFWFELLGTEGAASISPLRVSKEMQGAAVDVSPSGALRHENPVTASYRAEWASFVAAVRGEIAAPKLEPQVAALRLLEAIRESAEEGRE
ncbi:MAG: Gfo/Idh/MocA family oxidoreductase, partial [Gemmatimonadales bacterium]